MDSEFGKVDSKSSFRWRIQDIWDGLDSGLIEGLRIFLSKKKLAKSY